MKTKDAALELAVDVVFRYHRDNMGFDASRTRLTREKREHIVARLRENGGDVSELLFASDGCRLDDGAMGRTSRGGPWNDFENVYRNRTRVEKFVRNVPAARREGRHPFLNGGSDGHV